MVRVKRGNVARNRRNKILKIAKGFRGTHSKLFRMANQQVMKALRYSYVRDLLLALLFHVQEFRSPYSTLGISLHRYMGIITFVRPDSKLNI